MDILRFGMVGGGEGAFIGQVHRLAAQMDGLAQLQCGAFSSDPQRSIRSGQQIYGLDTSCCYASYEQMLSAQADLPENKRIQFVVVVTPNHMHFPVVRAALQAGFAVVCDKPLALSVAQAEQLAELVQNSQLKFALTHNYTGYSMIREARELVASGDLGKVRRVQASYLQGWLATDQQGNKQADWRTDPARSGAAGCFGDIGSHAQNLAEYVCGQSIESVCADLSSFVPGRALDDDGNVLLRFTDGARGVISASQVAVGKENDLMLEIYGELGGLEWRQSDANSLIVRWSDRPYEVRRAGGPGTGEASLAATRVPAGHPEGYLEAFAEVYRNFALDMNGQPHHGYPNIDDGVHGMKFIEAVVRSSAGGAVWVNL